MARKQKKPKGNPYLGIVTGRGKQYEAHFSDGSSAPVTAHSIEGAVEAAYAWLEKYPIGATLVRVSRGASTRHPTGEIIEPAEELLIGRSG